MSKRRKKDAPAHQVEGICLLALVDLDRVDEPVRLGEGLRVGGDVVGARRREGRALGVLRPHLAGPVAAQRGVEDEVLLLEVRGDVAALAAVELGERLAPRRRRRVARGHVGRDGAAREEPDGDGLRVEVDRVHAAADGVEAVAVVLVAGGRLAAPGAGVARVAVLLLERRGGDGAVVGDGAAGAGVQRHGVGLLSVDALDDVNLARVGPAAVSLPFFLFADCRYSPVGTKHPERRPDAAAARGHVRNVGDKQTRVVRLVGRDAHRLAALTGSLGVDAEVDAVLREAGEALVVGRLRAGVRLRPLCRVGLVEEAELVEEVGLVEVVVEDVLLRLGQPGAE